FSGGGGGVEGFAGLSVRVFGFYSRIQRFKDSKIQGFKDSKIQGFKDSKIQGFKDSRIQRFKDSKIQGFKDSRIQELQYIMPFIYLIFNFLEIIN
ncbi:MAG: hypothetical protein M9926_17270, partial [Lentimicrobium sp.]|uniref:hypothetical protein n=1 Tax=Lentimicrobium sp. TaxID=2034841 RepID=UPI0025D6D81A